MNPYDVDIDKLKESKKITNESELLKLKLVSAFLKAISEMKTEDILATTGLDKSDLSRLRAINISRFSIDRIINLLDLLGFSANIDIQPKEAS